MASTAEFTLQATMRSFPEGGTNNWSLSFSNSSAVGSKLVSTATTALGSAVAVVCPTSARVLVIIPPATNSIPLRLTVSTAEVGIPLSSVGPTIVSVVGGSTYYLYTTGTTAVPFQASIY